MQGILEFKSLAEAIRAGFEPFERRPDGCLVRTRTASGWALAFARVQPGSREAAR